MTALHINAHRVIIGRKQCLAIDPLIALVTESVASVADGCLVSWITLAVKFYQVVLDKFLGYISPELPNLL